MKKNILSTALIAIFSNTSALAADIDNTWYLGAGIGQSNYENVSSTGNGYLSDDSDLAWNALVGYQLNKYFAIEAGWQDLGTLDDSHMRTDLGQNIEAKGFTLGLVGTLPLSGKWFLTGEAGAMQYHLGHQMDRSHYVSATDTAPYFGAGLGYQFTDALSIAAKYRRYSGIDETAWNTANMDAQTIGIQMTYRFGVKPTQTAVVLPAVIKETKPMPRPEPKFETKVEKHSIALLFGFDSAELTQAAQAKLDEVVRLSKQQDTDVIMLEGQADNQGDATYNLMLSEQRVQQVESYLTAKGVQVNKIEKHASGEQEAHANSLKERALERRVILTLTSETKVRVS
ncbi:outer membrane beta-barrel protein [Shewanella waksmanii]|uniref:outer membrane beta-barrel protein n=1 Tax=Shewanella waksmanii TaxID=213783 RepID=UPI0037356ABF